MRIRKLELFGFKSFPDRTVVEFGPGICCVVGPNGCGKSNIMDAIRWVIGEQSAKSLRGDDMLDVVFAGSADRAPVGFAEVVLVLTSDDGEPFPGEYARFTELSVGRRLHRTGASEYLINRERVRRKDVVDLFLDTGIGNNLYSFIEQGSIGKLVAATPEQRRGIIEEAAGIAKYRARRAEAQQKLEQTATQLDRAADVEQELGKRLRVVEGQVWKAGRYKRLRARVRQREVALALARFLELVDDRRTLARDLRVATEAVSSAERAVARHEETLVERREEAAVLEAVVATRRDEAAEADAAHREVVGAIAFLERRGEELSAEAGRLDEDRVRSEAQRDGAIDEAAAAARDIEGLDALLVVTLRDREARERALEAAQVERASALGAVQTAERELAGLEATRVAARKRAEELRAAVRGNSERASRLDADLAAVDVDLADRATALSEAEGRVASLTGEVEAARGHVASATADADATKVALVAAQSASEASRRDVARIRQEVATATAAADAALAKLDADERRARRERDDAQRLAVETATRHARERVQVAERDAARLVSEAEAHERVQLAELDRTATSAVAAVRSDVARRLAEAEAAVAGRVASIEAQVAADVERAEQAADADGVARLASLTDERAAAAQARDVADVAVGEGRVEATAARASVAAEDAALQASERRLAAASEGMSAEVVARLRVARRLTDDGPGPDGADVALRRHLRLPGLDTDGVLAVGAALGDGQEVDVWWWPDGQPTWQDALGRVARCADLAHALRHHRETGGAAVTPDGDRVDADGVVHLGQSAVSGPDVVGLARERDDARARLDAARDALTRADARLTDLQKVAIAARDAFAAADRRLEEASRAVRADVAAVRAQARRAAGERVAAARAHEDVGLRKLRDAGQIDVTDAQARAQAWIGASRAHWRAAVEAQRAGGAAAVRAAREAADQAIAERRAAAQTDAQAAEATLGAERVRLAEARAATASAGATRLADAETADESVTAAATRARADHDARVTARDRVVAALRDVEVALVRATGDVQRLTGALELLRARKESLVRDRERFLADTEAADARIGVADAEVARLDVEVERPRAALAEAQSALAAADQRLDEVRTNVSIAEIEIASTRERAAGRRLAQETAERRRLEAIERLASLAARKEEVASALAEQRSELAGQVSRLDRLADERGAAWDRFQVEKQRLDDARGVLRTLEEDGRELLATRDAAVRTLASTEGRSRDVHVELDALVQRIDERYLVSLAGLVDRLDAQGKVVLDAEPDVQLPLEVGKKVEPGVESLVLRPDSLTDGELLVKWASEMEADRAAAQSLGDVNLGALEEYTDVKQRHDDLLAQRTDLESSVASIRAAIAKMNRECREKFRDAFDRVNEAFQEAYPRLVGGGRARLSLTDEEDLLQTGVEVFAQPPGKRLQNLTLLSGGEKAMTALAMIVALFRVKPSPFCLLDEVDAPLDEANGARFNDMLREMSRTAQFIVISHNRKTMECADTLYGITMGQPGVSRLVSVKMG
jgi:chromosome segregation protein